MIKRMRIVLIGLFLASTTLFAGQAPLKEQARQAIHRASAFFRTQVSTEGGYLWRYSEDLTRREGEGKATDTMVWVQPPGTPAVGMAFLRAYETYGRNTYRAAVAKAGDFILLAQMPEPQPAWAQQYDRDMHLSWARKFEPAGSHRVS